MPGPFKIGSLEFDNNLLLAPMAGWGDWPLRLISRRLGAGLVCSEFISTEGIVRDGERTKRYLEIHPDEHPLSMQVFGNKPDRIARAAQKIVDAGADIVDLNFGCPVKKVTATGAGAAILQTPELAPKIVEAVRKAVSVPVTVKMRSGFTADRLVYLEVGRLCAEAGADAITLHPRTRSQGYAGHSDWSHIAELVEAIDIPVIGNGDVTSPAEAKAMLEQTGCAAVMIGRAAVGNPWIFKQAETFLATGEVPAPPTLAERLETLIEHLDFKIEKSGVVWGVRQMRSIMPRYISGLRGSRELRRQLVRVDDRNEVVEMITQFFNSLSDEDQPGPDPPVEFGVNIK